MLPPAMLPVPGVKETSPALIGFTGPHLYIICPGVLIGRAADFHAAGAAGGDPDEQDGYGENFRHIVEIDALCPGGKVAAM